MGLGTLRFLFKGWRKYTIIPCCAAVTPSLAGSKAEKDKEAKEKEEAAKFAAEERYTIDTAIAAKYEPFKKIGEQILRALSYKLQSLATAALVTVVFQH
jgi:hypothetical protein